MQLAVFISVYLLAGLPLWLTPVAHGFHHVQKAIASLRTSTTPAELPAFQLAYSSAN